MKYIKIFEEFGNEYYELISEVEFDILIGAKGGLSVGDELEDDISDEKWDVFSKEEINTILNYFPNCNHCFEKWADHKKEHLAIFKDCDIDDPNSSLYISIYKINDEWWAVDENQDEFILNTGKMIDHHKLYKCDQFEGIIHLLNDKKYFT